MDYIPAYFGIFGHNVTIILPENRNATQYLKDCLNSV